MQMASQSEGGQTKSYILLLIKVGRVVCEHVFACDLSIPPPVWCQSFIRQRTCFSGDKRAPNTFRLTAQTKWRSKGSMHVGICAQRCKDARDNKKQNTFHFLLSEENLL